MWTHVHKEAPACPGLTLPQAFACALPSTYSPLFLHLTIKLTPTCPKAPLPLDQFKHPLGFLQLQTLLPERLSALKY